MVLLLNLIPIVNDFVLQVFEKIGLLADVGNRDRFHRAPGQQSVRLRISSPSPSASAVLIVRLKMVRSLLGASAFGGLFGAIVVPEPHAKHHTQPHQDAERSVQKRRFCRKVSFSVLPVMVWRLIRNQQVVQFDSCGSVLYPSPVHFSSRLSSSPRLPRKNTSFARRWSARPERIVSTPSSRSS